MLESWAQYNFNKIGNDPEQICSLQIWLNSYLLIENKPFIFINAFNSGLRKISQLFDDNNIFISFDELSQHFHISHFEYMQIWYSIPLLWKRMLTIHGISREIIPCKIDRISTESKISATIYNYFISGEVAIQKRKNRWEHKFAVNISLKNFFQYFKNIYKVTIATK